MNQVRILVIEDNIDNMALFRFLLEQAGFTVIEARSGRVGLELAAAEAPDLILLDMSIPEVDGWQVARQLKDNPQTRSICVVALTGHTLPGDRKKALDAGCDGYLSKPLDLPSFIDQINQFLQMKPA